MSTVTNKVRLQNLQFISDMTYTICIYIIHNRFKIKQYVGLDIHAKGTSAYVLSVAQHSNMVYYGIMSKIGYL
jgi:multisubunit Na+/H+ antiporter MnhC subunit